MRDEMIMMVSIIYMMMRMMMKVDGLIVITYREYQVKERASARINNVGKKDR